MPKHPVDDLPLPALPTLPSFGGLPFPKAPISVHLGAADPALKPAAIEAIRKIIHVDGEPIRGIGETATFECTTCSRQMTMRLRAGGEAVALPRCSACGAGHWKTLRAGEPADDALVYGPAGVVGTMRDERRAREFVGGEIYKHLGARQPPPVAKVEAARIIVAAVELLEADMVRAIGAGAIGTFEELVALGEEARANKASPAGVAVALGERFRTGKGEEHDCYAQESCVLSCPAYARWRARCSYNAAAGGKIGFAKIADRPKPAALTGRMREDFVDIQTADAGRLRYIGSAACLAWGLGETDEQYRGRLLRALFGDVLDVEPSKPGDRIAVPCSRPGCGQVTVHALGTQDPTEGRCVHSFRFDPCAGVEGHLACTNCPLSICMRVLVTAIEAQGRDPRRRYDRKHNDVADEAQRLRDENTKVLADNARLRFELEARDRKARARR